tara:strand:- start:171 stop:551 length:381 start_codon:yes stop_codon:yes gene_type:complete
MGCFNSIYKYTTRLLDEEEEQFTVEVRHGGNQLIDEFYIKNECGQVDYNTKKHLTFQLGKSKTILDVKKKLMKNIKYLHNLNFNLRTTVGGKIKGDTYPLMRTSDKENPDNNVINLFIQIPNWSNW